MEDLFIEVLFGNCYLESERRYESRTFEPTVQFNWVRSMVIISEEAVMRFKTATHFVIIFKYGCVRMY